MGGSASANALTGGIDQFFTRTDSSGTVTPLRDGLGSVIALADSSGTIQTGYSYEPFGKTTGSGAASNNLQKYTGREDDGTGLYYYRARYYSPSLQRFISEDPIGIAGGINPYVYVGNNPINFRDPSGLKPTEYFLGASGTVAAGFGDSLTFAPILYLVSGAHGSWTGLARSLTGADGAVDRDSWWYTGGEVLAALWTAGVGAAAEAGQLGIRELYESEVRSLANYAEGLAKSGLGEEEIAREVVFLRRAIGLKYKDLTPPELLDKILKRNFDKYGDYFGPTIDWLRARGYSWRQIIEKAAKPGGHDLGF